MKVVATTMVVMLAGPLAANASGAADWIEASHEAVFSAEQTISCVTPDGARDGVFTVEGSGSGVTIGQGVGLRWFGVDGVFAANSNGKAAAVAVPTNDPVPAAYTSVELRGERFDGRRTVSFMLRRDGIERAVMSFDVATGAVLSVTTYNVDGSEYCSVDTISFDQPVGLPTPDLAPTAEVTLERVASDPVLAPHELAGFVRLDTYQWRESGTVSFYSDGFFSFTLINSDVPLLLDDTDAGDFELDGGTYRRLFEAGQSMYVWETERGGMSLVGDLPLDLQENVLSELPGPGRANLFVRFWRRFFR